MNVHEMRIAIIDKYGPTIRGKLVEYMSERQVFAIYRSIQQREEKELQAKKKLEGKHCGTCSWFCDNMCNMYHVVVYATSPACTQSYTDIRTRHQMSMFESQGGNQNDQSNNST